MGSKGISVSESGWSDIASVGLDGMMAAFTIFGLELARWENGVWEAKSHPSFFKESCCLKAECCSCAQYTTILSAVENSSTI